MEAAAKQIGKLASNYLPTQPHHLALSTTTQYRVPPDDRPLEESVVLPLQYSTFVCAVDRGILFTRAYYDIRKDHKETVNNAPSPSKLKPTQNKPVTKLSLKDYKNKQKGTAPRESDSPRPSAPQTQPSPAKHSERNHVVAKRQPEPIVAKDMERPLETKKLTHPLPPRPELPRPNSTSPEKKKRVHDEEDDRAAKRNKVGNSISSSHTSHPPSKSTNSHTVDKHISSGRENRDAKSSVLTNGRSVSSSGSKHASPRLDDHTNGSQKSFNHHHSTSKDRLEEHSNHKANLPPLLSPLRLSSFDMAEKSRPQQSPKKKPAEKEMSQPRGHIKDRRDEPERTSTPKKSRIKIPPLLSPTLPPIVMEELRKANKSTPSRDSSSQKTSTSSDTPIGARRTAAKTVQTKKDTIHVDSNNIVDNEEGSETLTIKLKYPKRRSKDVQRLLALAPRKKAEVVAKKETADAPRKEHRVGRDRSDSLEPSVARKRPRPATDASEQSSATKRPKISENGQPTTPSKQSVAMQRVTSSSSQAGTPGAANLTPVPPNSSERRRTPMDPEKLSRLRKRYNDLVALGTKLKHSRDSIMKTKEGKPPPSTASPERHEAMALGIQSSLAYMVGFKASDDVRDAERKPRDPSLWSSLVGLIRAYRHDCQESKQLTALLSRLYAICLVWHGKALRSLGVENGTAPQQAAREFFQNMNDQEIAWKVADSTRKKLGVFNGSPGSDDGGSIAKLIDRLGPWTFPDEAVHVGLEILRRVIRTEKQFSPIPQLIEISDLFSNGSDGPGHRS